MKKFMMMVAVATALFSCGQKQTDSAKESDTSTDSLGGTFTGLDEKSDVIRRQIDAYNAQDTTYAGEGYADNVKIYYPSDTAVDLSDKKSFVADFKAQYNYWKSPRFDRARVITLKLNNGETWTNVWGVMIAKGSYTGHDILVPLHRAIQWEGDKVVRDIHLYDTKQILEEIAAKAAAEKK